jgi:hypothetical protein
MMRGQGWRHEGLTGSITILSIPAKGSHRQTLGSNTSRAWAGSGLPGSSGKAKELVPHLSVRSVLFVGKPTGILLKRPFLTYLFGTELAPNEAKTEL